jgi:hypothetical protein
MRPLFAILSIALLSSDPGCGSAGDDGFINLFNGRDLTGWDFKISGHELNDNYLNTFRVEEGILKVSYDEYDRFDGEFVHIFCREKFSEYILRVEYRFTGEQAPGDPSWAARNKPTRRHASSKTLKLSCPPWLVSRSPVTAPLPMSRRRGAATRWYGWIATVWSSLCRPLLAAFIGFPDGRGRGSCGGKG